MARVHEVCLSTSGGYWRVLVDGQPVCRDTDETTARQLARNHRDTFTRHRRPVTVSSWNGDTGEYREAVTP